jgi:hypothetical protein
MGASMSWLVASEDAYEDIKKVLNVSELVQGKGPSLVGHRSKNKMIHLFETRERGWTFDNPSLRATLSSKHTVHFFQYETHVMFSAAALWKDGHEIWAVSHTSENGIFDLKATGTLPASFETHKANRFNEQKEAGGEDADVDVIIEIPMDLSKELTGYHPDEGEEEESIALYSAKRSFFARILGAT